MVFGMITMFLPPFGALLSKWMVIEASAHNPMVVIMLALGSAFTVVFWARWAGLILCNTRKSVPQSESQPLFIRLALLPLAVLGFILSLLVAPIYSTVVAPVVGLYYQKGFYLLSQGGFSSEIGAFSIYPLFFIFILGLVWSLRAVRKDRACNYVAPYMAGIGAVQEDQYGHKGPLGKFFAFTAGNFYLVEYIGEDRLVSAINLVAIGTIVVSLAGVF
jgi:ech hydrogenase subunit A